MQTLIINYGNLNIGGIEKYIAQLTEYLTENGGRVIWLRDPVLKIAEIYRELFLGNSVERVIADTSKYTWFKHGDLHFSKDDDIVILSFDPMSMARSLQLKEEYSAYRITPYYAVPNTTGNLYYIERYFSGKNREKIRMELAKIHAHWESMDLIRFFSIQQVHPLEKNYNFHVNNKNEKVLPAVFAIEKLNQELLQERSKRKYFTIGTLGRFDFPHKGYMLGLVRSYGRLKEIYPEIRLKIGGYGPDEGVLKKEIRKLPAVFQKDIVLAGAVDPQNVNQFFSDVHLNISVAGAVWDGAKCGVVSIPARNYCDGECEVYGYLPQSRNMTASLELGECVDTFIEYVIRCSEDEYRHLCEDSYNTCLQKTAPWPTYLFDTKPQKYIEVDSMEIKYMKRLMKYVRTRQYLEILDRKLKMLGDRDV